MTVTVDALSRYIADIGHGAWSVQRQQDNALIVIFDQVKGKRASYVYADADRTFHELRAYYRDEYQRRRCSYCGVFAPLEARHCGPCGAPLP